MPVHLIKKKGGFMLAEPSGKLSPHRLHPGRKNIVAAQARIINQAVKAKQG